MEIYKTEKGRSICAIPVTAVSGSLSKKKKDAATMANKHFKKNKGDLKVVKAYCKDEDLYFDKPDEKFEEVFAVYRAL